jgi:IS30 family transposase
MRKITRHRYLNKAEQAEMWRRWKAGESSRTIARGLKRADSSIHVRLHQAGGFAPRIACRSARALSIHEREEISLGLRGGESIRSIAERMGRAASTVSREIGRNGGPGNYRASRADEAAWERARRPQDYLLQERPALAELVTEKLKLKWAPQQIAGWLKGKFPHDAGMQVSHETIYRTLFIQARGALNKELTGYLRRRTKLRHSRNAVDPHARQGMPDAISISDRPAEVEDRAVPGHWEGDLLCGGLHSQIATLVERRSRYTMLVKVANKETQTVVQALTEHVKHLPASFMKTLTWDRGSEMTNHANFTIATDIKVYICDPRSPWQRGTNENTNGLLRQYFPKGFDLSNVTQEELNAVAAELNNRPRQTLGFETPANTILKVLH